MQNLPSIAMPRALGTIQDVSGELERLLVVSTSRSLNEARINSLDTFTDDIEHAEEEHVDAGRDHQDPVEDIVVRAEIPIGIRNVNRQSSCPDSSQILRRRQGEATSGPAAPHNSLETSVIDLCDESILTTNETVFEEAGPALPTDALLVPEETILIDDDEDEESQRAQEIVDMFEAQVRAYNTRAVPGADATIVLSESEEEEEESAEGGSLEETLNILTIKCPICLAGFREIQEDGKASSFITVKVCDVF